MKWGNSERFLSLRGSFDAYFGILQTKAFFDYSVSVSMRSGMPKINRDELNAFEFLAPNESEQRAIGDILLKLDDLITLHQ
ncbi:hypothetical protein I050019G5_05140 [Collinsella sp. i05-0019-G5]|uniref:restriction endonuclease subunit S n=1 Tax=Collinsella sp. i05-0019-G5 TaxID=3132705 RepID=UPI0036F1A00C